MSYCGRLRSRMRNLPPPYESLLWLQPVLLCFACFLYCARFVSSSAGFSCLWTLSPRPAASLLWLQPVLLCFACFNRTSIVPGLFPVRQVFRAYGLLAEWGLGRTHMLDRLKGAH